MGSKVCKDDIFSSLNDRVDSPKGGGDISERSAIIVKVENKGEKPRVTESKYFKFSVYNLNYESVFESRYAIFPTMILHHICEYLTCREIINMTLVCKGFQSVIETNEFWQSYLDQMTLSSQHFCFRPSLSSQRLEIKSSKELFLQYFNSDFFYGQLYSLKNDTVTDSKKKIVFSGSKKVGKTRIVESYALNKIFSYQVNEEEEGEEGIGEVKYEKDDYVPTIGASYETITITQSSSVIGDNAVGIEVWDVSGDERYASLRPIYYNESLCVCLCFSYVIAKSFEEVKSEVDELLKNKQNLMIVGTMADLLHDPNQDAMEVTREEVSEFVSSKLETHENYLGYIEVSTNAAFHGVKSRNIHTLFSFIAQQLFEEQRETSFED